jgi:hypothetical protein
MPWTFAHPAAVLPLRKYFPAQLNLFALACGSMAPDYGYHMGSFDTGTYAHTPLGSVLVCVPSGLALLGLIYLLRKPLWFVFPQPHRAALAPLARARFALRPKAILMLAVSVFLGTWTHIAWDSFTHKRTWTVRQIPLLERPLFQFNDALVPLYSVLQHCSTVVGLIVLVWVYRNWLKSSLDTSSGPIPRDGDGMRYALWVASALAAAAIAIPSALEVASAVDPAKATHAFVFESAVRGAAAFIALLVLCALVHYRLRGIRPELQSPTRL